MTTTRSCHIPTIEFTPQATAADLKVGMKFYFQGQDERLLAEVAGHYHAIDTRSGVPRYSNRSLDDFARLFNGPNPMYTLEQLASFKPVQAEELKPAPLKAGDTIYFSHARRPRKVATRSDGFVVLVEPRRMREVNRFPSFVELEKEVGPGKKYSR